MVQLRNGYRAYDIGCYGCVNLQYISFEIIGDKKIVHLGCKLHGRRRRKVSNCPDEINPVKNWEKQNG